MSDSARPLAVVLAAGEGSRMGFPKALLRYAGAESFLSHLAAVFGEASCDVMAVVGAEAERVQAAHPGIRTVLNPHWREGQLSSVHAGLKAALQEGAHLILIHLVDMPELRADTVSRLCRAVAGEGSFPMYDGQRGHPLVLTAAGAREVLRADAETLADATFRLHLQGVDVPDPGIAVNFNTPDVYLRVFGTDPASVDGGTALSE
ncbi:MAG TPA: nucleotidyltransferase family protein [Myxococcaceae bacterium]|nr:nucleotidyltransferase family protein [Myxococcaceae bacterium]